VVKRESPLGTAGGESLTGNSIKTTAWSRFAAQ
jgi:hypothetical protein